MEDKIKYVPNKDEIIEIDEFLRRFRKYKGDFVFSERYKEYYKDYPNSGLAHEEKLYDLVAHHTNIISQHSFENKRNKFTEKGLEIYEHDGYKNWSDFNEERIRFIRGQPKRDIDLHNSMISLNSETGKNYEFQKCISTRMFWATIVSVLLAATTAVFIWQQNNFIEADGIESESRLQEMQKIQQGINLLNTKLDSVSHGVLDVRILKSDSVHILPSK